MGSDLNVTIGALLIGVLVTAVGYGITTLQTYSYMSHFPKDPLGIRSMVWSLLLLDTSHVVFSWHMIYYYLVLNFGNDEALRFQVWSFNITIVITSVITVIVHCFYAWRILVLSRGKRIIPLIILALSLIRIVFGCIVTARIFVLKDFTVLPKKITNIVATALGSGTIADCVITATLVYYLHAHKSGINPLNSFLDKVMYWTVNNGFLTSIVGVIFLITFAAMPHNMIFLAVHLLLSKLYSNSLLATLNFRSSYRGRGVDSNGNAISMSTFGRGVASQGAEHDSNNAKVAANGPVVHIVTTTGTMDSGSGAHTTAYKADTLA